MQHSNPNNAFKGWDIVSVPYCTGALNLGIPALSSCVSKLLVEGEKHVFATFEGYSSTMNDSGETLSAVLIKWLRPHSGGTATPTTSLDCRSERSPTMTNSDSVDLAIRR